MTPGKARSAPVALAPAMRPCLLACVPSWTFIGRSSTRCQDSTQSPAAKTPSWPGQRWWSSTRSAPLAPSSRPASRARAVAGRTPVAMTTWSAASSSPSTRTACSETSCSSAPRRTSDADALGRVLHVGGHVLVEGGHDLAGALDERHAQAALHERLGHLEADVAAADDDRAARRRAAARRGSARRRRRCAPARSRRRPGRRARRPRRRWRGRSGRSPRCARRRSGRAR